MASHILDASRNTFLNAIVTALTATSRLKIYDNTGAIPTKTQTPATNGAVLLATLTLSATAGTVATGVLTMGTITSAVAVASGTPTWYRLIDGTTDDGTHTQLQGTCAVGSGDINFPSTIASGGTVGVSSLTYTEGNN